ncbi:MAG: TraB/GumN family protein, partial [Clostridia bacterium]|nr:TraB/GumN family protein [Clostridia bacterium]
NIKIADGIKEYLASGERVFVAVDCSHIVGNDGIAAVLQSGGYKVIRK